MRTAYKVSNINGTALFASRAEAERCAKGRPPGWGSAVGLPAPTIREVRVFDTAEEWQRYSGSHSWNLS